MWIDGKEAASWAEFVNSENSHYCEFTGLYLAALAALMAGVTSVEILCDDQSAVWRANNRCRRHGTAPKMYELHLCLMDLMPLFRWIKISWQPKTLNRAAHTLARKAMRMRLARIEREEQTCGER